MDAIIQMRVTRTSDKHVCKVCGKDAYLRGVSYEATTQELADQFHAELKQAQTWEAAKKLPATSPVTDAVFDVTVVEQRESGPHEHERFYECADCFGRLFSYVMGNDSGSFAIDSWLLKKPLDHALFCARKIDTPDQCLLIAAPGHDPLFALAALKDTSVPHFDTSRGRPRS